MNFDFKECLDKFGEVGYVRQVWHAVGMIEGMPGVTLHEVVVGERGGLAWVIGLGTEGAEVVWLTGDLVKIGERMARTGEALAVMVNEEMLGRTVDGLGQVSGEPMKGKLEKRLVELVPGGIVGRAVVDKALETGVSIVDVVLPLGKGQRELVIGDRRSGKSRFVRQVVVTQVQSGAVCVYCLVGKRQEDLVRLKQFLSRYNAVEKVVIVEAGADDVPGAIVMAPYTAMAIAEYFRDLGRDVLLVLDDLTLHATFYRQIALLLRRFPGRNSYPGDIFHLHAKLLERAGNFIKGSITCLPVAEATFGDLSGYIQTNLMAVTDGHLFFDGDLANLGRLPALNPFLSVTRVGRQAQMPLLADASRVVGEFLAREQHVRQFLHFGAELTEKVQRELALGDRLYGCFFLSSEDMVPIGMSALLLGALWAGQWEGVSVKVMQQEMKKLIDRYRGEARYRQEVDELLAGMNKFEQLVGKLREKPL